MRFRIGIPVAALLCASSGAAWAGDPASPPSLDWHVTLAGSAGLLMPSGNLEAGLPQRDLLADGGAFGFELGFGFATRLTAGLWGQYGYFGAGSRCSDCSGTTIGAGPFVGLHLVPGGRFDPWATAGLGYRATSAGTTVDQSPETWSGLEWLRLQVGGDWYAFKKSGFGAFLEMDAGTFGKRTPGQLGASSAHYSLIVGARFVFDTQGRDAW